MREFLASLLLLILSPATVYAVRCLDCVGSDCMGTFCEGDYCVLSRFAPRWGSTKFGEATIVKGCMSGSMMRNDIRDHCEVSDEDGGEIFTCFCNGKDNCNGGKTQRKLERDPVELIECICAGDHCGRSETCIGELCSYVYNHKTKEVEQGCVNASIPLVERRSAGSCMIPPITGAMHHNVAKEAKDLLVTESCVCGTEFCNVDKPETTREEKMKCPTYVNAELMGNKMRSKNVTCTGEFCFKARMKSSISSMKEYETAGCASFSTDAPLAEEMQPIGCARFKSEALEVEACFQTKDKRAIARARANQEVPERKESVRKQKVPKGRKPPPRVEVQEINDDDEDEENEEVADAQPETEKEETVDEKETEKEEEAEKKKEEEEKEDEEEGEEEEEKQESKPEATTMRFVFEKPTQPPIPDDSNTTMITVFILIILCIVVAGAVFKFELHKRLFRANYDSVAGG